MNVLKFLIAQCFFLSLPIRAWWRPYQVRCLAVITVPVADMLIHDAHHYSACDAAHLYHELPLSCTSSGWPCIRAHQCLMNEVLFDASWNDEQCSGNLPDAYYGVDQATGEPLYRYFTLATNTRSLEELRARGLDLDSLPPPTSIKERSSISTLMLIMPWYDPVTKVTYSAGTRFVRVPALDTGQHYGIRVVDYQQFQARDRLVSKTLCLIERQRSMRKKRSLFIELLKKWAQQPQGQIPYVLGGSSFIELYGYGAPFEAVAASSGPNRMWVRPGSATVQSGFDCSELVWRAARMADITYYYKNTSTLARFLQPLGPTDRLHNGDLIWVPGHVMVISDVRNNELIESTGYSGGYGVVHSISLAKRLGADHATYRDVVRAYRAQEGISIYSRDGTPQWYPAFTIFKLGSEPQGVL